MNKWYTNQKKLSSLSILSWYTSLTCLNLMPGGSEDTLCCLSASESRTVPGGLPAAEWSQVGITGPRQTTGWGLWPHRERPDTAGSHCCGGQVTDLLKDIFPSHYIDILSFWSNIMLHFLDQSVFSHKVLLKWTAVSSPKVDWQERDYFCVHIVSLFERGLDYIWTENWRKI